MEKQLKMTKRKVIHIIDNLGRGGAETMLVELLPDLNKKYELILVTLTDRCDFDDNDLHYSKRYILQYKGYSDLWFAAKRLNKIIKAENPDIIRSQLYWSTIVTRLAIGKSTPYLFSVHATVDEDPIVWYKKKFINLLEKLTYHPRQHMMGVTRAVVDSFTRFHPKHGKTYLLHNFVRDQFFKTNYQFSFDGNRHLKITSVGNIRLIKNVSFLVEVMNLLKEYNIILDVYGDGDMQTTVQEQIDRYGLKKMTLKGTRKDIHQVLPDYDIYISASTVEGFGIAVAEAMSVGLPAFISDIPVYREIGGEQAIYFDNKNARATADLLIKALSDPDWLAGISSTTKEYAKQHFLKSNYIDKLDNIYSEISH